MFEVTSLRLLVLVWSAYQWLNTMKQMSHHQHRFDLRGEPSKSEATLDCILHFRSDAQTIIRGMKNLI